MSDPDEIPLADVIDVLGLLPELVRDARERRGLSQRAAAAQIGVPFSSVSRAEAGAGLHLATAVALLRWVNTGEATCPACGHVHACVGARP